MIWDLNRLAMKWSFGQPTPTINGGRLEESMLSRQALVTLVPPTWKFWRINIKLYNTKQTRKKRKMHAQWQMAVKGVFVSRDWLTSAVRLNCEMLDSGAVKCDLFCSCGVILNKIAL